MSLPAQDIAYLKSQLIQKQADLLQVKKVGEGAAEVVELDQTKVGRLSRMDAMQAQAMSVETNRRREIELQRIATALIRLEQNEYGFCLRCGENIARKRLEVDPAATVCIECASLV
jgi:DnaK suppressor protein